MTAVVSLSTIASSYSRLPFTPISCTRSSW